MCVVSMIGDHYRETIPQKYFTWPTPPEITRAEFDDLKRQVLEMKELLKRAKKYDEDNGEPDCEIDEKMEVLRRVAKLVGVDLSEVIGDKHATGK